MNKKINPEIIDEMVEYYKTHTSLDTEIKYGITRGLPQYYHNRKYGYKKPNDRNRLTDKLSKELAEFARYNTIGSAMQKFNVSRKTVLLHYGNHYNDLPPSLKREMRENEIGNENRIHGEKKRVHELSKGEWFIHCSQWYRVGAKNEIFYTCNRYDYAGKKFNGKIELGIKNQMKVQTLVLKTLSN